MKIIAYIGAAILIFFGVLFVWGSGGKSRRRLDVGLRG